MTDRNEGRRRGHHLLRLDDGALAAATGGATVRIGEVTSSIRTEGESVLSPAVLGKIVGAVLDGIADAAANARRRPL